MAKHKDFRFKGITVEGGLISHLEHSGWDVTCKPHSRNGGAPLSLVSREPDPSTTGCWSTYIYNDDLQGPIVEALRCRDYRQAPLVLASLPVALSPGDKEAFRIALAILTWKMDQA